jgi:cobalt-zinc-cadmium efflux system membrane fusion protein
MNVRAISWRAWPHLARLSNTLIGGAIIAIGGGLLLSMWLGWVDILPYSSHVASDTPTEAPPPAPTTVELTGDKFAAAGIHVTRVKQQPLQPLRAVPGEIEYDKARRVPILAPVQGIVLEVLVEPEQPVQKGQPLAVLSSRQVGEARDEVEKRRADLDLARQEETRVARIAENVDDLLALLAQRPDPDQIEKSFAQKPLGDYRDKVLAPYSKLVLAERQLKDSTDVLGASLSKRTIEIRQSERQVAESAFHTARDNSRFDAHYSREKAKSVREQAERLLSVAQQNLKNLLGPLADMREVPDHEHSSELTLLAPIDGRIVERHTVKAALVQADTPLFTVADTSTMWISAAIHERDWRALDYIHRGEDLQVRVVALGDAQQTAKVQWIGAQLGDLTRSAPLVAELQNPDGRLKPGMFVWALIPLDQPHSSLVVPAGAIMRHENQPFVFVPEGERKYRRVDVETGIETNDQIEIVAGLKEGEEVVDQGAFHLKSELLLEREE